MENITSAQGFGLRACHTAELNPFIKTGSGRDSGRCGFLFTLPQIPLQGADNKLGQFLGQDIEASANHRNVLPPSLECYSSVVSRNVSKPSLVTKMSRQSTKLVRQF